MYESSLMLKHRKTHIVSTLFDTINKMSAEEDSASETAEASETADASASETAYVTKYRISVPNERLVLKKGKPVLICTYQVRTNGLYPFIMFLFNKKATFIKLDVKKQIKYAAIAYIQTILPSASLSYAGFYETEENNIIILSAEETNTIMSDYIWATSFEIMNIKKIMNVTVDPVVMTFFLANPAFLILKDERNCIYESPMIGYKSHQHACNEAEMDIYRETRDPLFGKCYYIDRDIPVASHTIMRIAFFAGKMVLNKEKSYDSLLCCDKYIIQNYDQHVVLSVFKPNE
jgi:hypothetical protein